jgi:diguanylate cyclase (GGDEF)-like protein
MPRGGLPKSFKILLSVAAGLIGLGVLAIGLTLWLLRSDAIRSAEQNAGNIATIVADHTAHVVNDIDRTLIDLRDLVTYHEITDVASLHRTLHKKEFYDYLVDRLTQLSFAQVVTVIDAEGRLVNSTRRWPLADLHFIDRDFFQYLRTHDDGQLYTALPVEARVVGTWTLYFARRLSTPSGEFLGVVGVGVPLSYFQRVYDSLGDLMNQSVLFLRRDGTAIIRYPDTIDRAGMKMPDGSPWYEVVAAGGGAYRSPGYFGDGPRWAAVRPLRDFALVVNIGVSETAVLATWRRRATWIGIGTLLAVICSGLLLWTVAGQVRRLADSEAAIAEREASLAEKSNEIEQANILLHAAVNNMSQGLCMFDQDTRLLLRNNRYLTMYRLSPAQVRPGCTARDMVEQRMATGGFLGDPEEYLASTQARIAEGGTFYQTGELADGRIVALSFQPIANGGWVVTHEDITERQKVEARIAHMARHDTLTSLANRLLFLERMEVAIERTRRLDENFAVLLFDLDLFKAVNDSLGHATGDELLRQFAARLESNMQPGWTAARVGGDEFAVIQVANSGQRAAAIGLAEKIIREVGAPFDIEGHRIVIGVSIGITLAPHDGDDCNELMKNADLALSRAKSEGRKGYRFFEAEMDAAARLHRALEVDLRNALLWQEFVLYYQPIVDIASQRICGTEALIRWKHPEHGMVAPDCFIPIAEETGLIIPLGEWILDTACAEAAKWPDHIRIAVNLSPIQFRSTRLVASVREALAKSSLPARRLELEITESVLLQKDEGNLATLHALSDLGVSIALDDFGTGYSSLSYLRTFPFEKIKIDRSFIADMSDHADCSAIVSAITSLSRSLDVVTTAEGVETREQLTLLKAVGCSQAQGYLFSRPVPATELDFDANYQHFAAA